MDFYGPYLDGRYIRSFVHIQYVEVYHTADATATHLINFPNSNLLQYKGENLANKIFTGGGWADCSDST